jgi:hypothetical protein
MNVKPISISALGLSLLTILPPGASAEGFGAWFDSAPIVQPYNYGSVIYAYPRYPVAYAGKPRHKVHTKFQTMTIHKMEVSTDKAGLPTQWSAMTLHLAAMQKETPGALRIFLSDPSLRKGDAIMTNVGLRIFWGSGTSKEHIVQDFIPLSFAKTQPHRIELADIQKVSAPPFEVAETNQTTAFIRAHHASLEFATNEPKVIRQIPGIR